MVLWALLAKIAAGDQQDNLHYFGRFAFASKMAQAVAALVIGGILSLFDYRAAESSGILTALMAGAPLMAGAICLILALIISVRIGLGPRNRRGEKPRRHYQPKTATVDLTSMPPGFARRI